MRYLYAHLFPPTGITFDDNNGLSNDVPAMSHECDTDSSFFSTILLKGEEVLYVEREYLSELVAIQILKEKELRRSISVETSDNDDDLRESLSELVVGTEEDDGLEGDKIDPVGNGKNIPATPMNGNGSEGIGTHNKSDESDGGTDSEYLGHNLECFNLPIIRTKTKTGFEPNKDLHIDRNDVIAGRYVVDGILQGGDTGAFSTAYKCLDLEADENDGNEYCCLKVIKNTKDYFDQSLDEIRVLKLLRDKCDNVDDKNVLLMRDFFYFKEHLFIVTELLKMNLFEFAR